jgi:glycine/D-amino acid oxidase-like deaminating enzyme
VSVVVVGAGVLGLIHAVEACQRGHHVVHLEREPGPRGASVRNFGLIWISGRTTRDEFEAAKAPHVLDSVADLLPLAGVGESGTG